MADSEALLRAAFTAAAGAALGTLTKAATFRGSDLKILSGGLPRGFGYDNAFNPLSLRSAIVQPKGLRLIGRVVRPSRSAVINVVLGVTLAVLCLVSTTAFDYLALLTRTTYSQRRVGKVVIGEASGSGTSRYAVKEQSVSGYNYRFVLAAETKVVPVGHGSVGYKSYGATVYSEDADGVLGGCSLERWSHKHMRIVTLQFFLRTAERDYVVPFGNATDCLKLGLEEMEGDNDGCSTPRFGSRKRAPQEYSFWRQTYCRASTEPSDDWLENTASRVIDRISIDFSADPLPWYENYAGLGFRNLTQTTEFRISKSQRLVSNSQLGIAVAILVLLAMGASKLFGSEDEIIKICVLLSDLGFRDCSEHFLNGIGTAVVKESKASDHYNHIGYLDRGLGPPIPGNKYMMGLVRNRKVGKNKGQPGEHNAHVGPLMLRTS